MEITLHPPTNKLPQSANRIQDERLDVLADYQQYDQALNLL